MAARASILGVWALALGVPAELAGLTYLPALDVLWPGLTEFTAEAIAQRTFEPAELADGTPVAVYYTLTVKFDLQ